LVWVAVVPVALWALVRTLGLDGDGTVAAAGHETLDVLSANVHRAIHAVLALP
jgi:hypothetical protein